MSLLTQLAAKFTSILPNSPQYTKYYYKEAPQFINTFQQPHIDEYKTNVKHTQIPNHSMWQKSYKGENGSLLIFYH